MANVYVHCRTQPNGGGIPIANVGVSLHELNTVAVLSGGVTDINGRIFLGDRPEGEYEIHVTSPLGASVQNGTLQKVTVVDGDPHIFDVVLDTINIDVAADPNLCRCTGYFVDPHGQPVADLTIRFFEGEAGHPTLLYYAGQNRAHVVIPKVRTVKTDSSGYASVDLIRGTQYGVYLEGYENISRSILVPELASASISDVIFPIVDGVEYTVVEAPGPAAGVVLSYNTPQLNLSAGQTAVLSVKTVHRSNLKLDGLVDVSVKSPSPDIFTMTVTDDLVTITAVAAGNAEVEVARRAPEKGNGVTIFPDSGVRGAINVTVT